MDANTGIMTGMAVMKDEDIVCAKTLAECNHCTQRTIRRMIERGELPQPFRMQGRSCWLVGDLKAHIEKLADDALKARKKADLEKAKILMKTTRL